MKAIGIIKKEKEVRIISQADLMKFSNTDIFFETFFNSSRKSIHILEKECIRCNSKYNLKEIKLSYYICSNCIEELRQ